MSIHNNHDAFNQDQSKIIDFLISQHEANQTIDNLRRTENVQNNQSKSSLSQNKFRDITDKLNKLEKALLRKNQRTPVANQPLNCSKYQQLNILRSKIQAALCKINQQQSCCQSSNIQAKIVTLFNKSVSTVIQQNRLKDKLHELKREHQTVSSQISTIKTELSLAEVQSNQRAVLRTLSTNIFHRITQKLSQQ